MSKHSRNPPLTQQKSQEFLQQQEELKGIIRAQHEQLKAQEVAIKRMMDMLGSSGPLLSLPASSEAALHEHSNLDVPSPRLADFDSEPDHSDVTPSSSRSVSPRMHRVRPPSVSPAGSNLSSPRPPSLPPSESHHKRSTSPLMHRLRQSSSKRLPSGRFAHHMHTDSDSDSDVSPIDTPSDTDVDLSDDATSSFRSHKSVKSNIVIQRIQTERGEEYPVHLCDHCNSHVAMVYCHTCDLRMCEKGGCDGSFHKPRRNRYHDRESLFPDTYQVRQYHHSTVSLLKQGSARSLLNGGSGLAKSTTMALAPKKPPLLSARPKRKSNPDHVALKEARDIHRPVAKLTSPPTGSRSAVRQTLTRRGSNAKALSHDEHDADEETSQPTASDFGSTRLVYHGTRMRRSATMDHQTSQTTLSGIAEEGSTENKTHRRLQRSLTTNGMGSDGPVKATVLPQLPLNALASCPSAATKAATDTKPTSGRRRRSSRKESMIESEFFSEGYEPRTRREKRFTRERPWRASISKTALDQVGKRSSHKKTHRSNTFTQVPNAVSTSRSPRRSSGPLHRANSDKK